MHLEGLVIGASWLFSSSPLQCDDSDKESGDAKVAIVTLSTEYDREILKSRFTAEGISYGREDITHVYFERSACLWSEVVG
jgi:hypothetical protein